MSLDKLITQLSKLADNKKRFVVTESKKYSFNIINKNLTKVTEGESNSVYIDLINNAKRFTKSVDARDFNFIKKNIRELEKYEVFKDQQFYNTFPEFQEPVATKILDQEILDFGRADLEDLIPLILEMHAELKVDKTISSIDTNFGFSIYKKNLIVDNCVFEDLGVKFGLSSFVSVNRNSESSHELSRDFFTIDDFDLEKYKLDLQKKIDNESNPNFDNSIDAKKYDLILPPQKFSDVLDSFVISKMSLENYIKKDNYVWQNVSFDSKLNIMEDPFIEYSFYSKLYDNDFVLTTKKKLIDKGAVGNYLSDLEMAFKYDGKTTGNALDSEVTNVSVNEGVKSFDDLIKYTKKGLIILDMLGMHTTNSNEGSLNVTCPAAIEIIAGEKKRILKNVSINENIVNLLKNIELSKEKEWSGNYYLPTVFCRR